MTPFTIDWDAGNLAKCQQHGVSVAEMEWALTHEPFIAPDAGHSAAEQRWIAVGRSQVLRAMYVAFTLRVREGLTLVRPVSARYMHAKELKRYEQTAPDSPVNDNR